MAEVTFTAGTDAARLERLYQREPLRVLFPRPAADDLTTAVLVTTSGGLVAGDRLDIAFGVGRGARALFTAQAAEKVYRSTGAEVRIETRLTAGDGSWLEWLPQGTILFEAARLRRRTAAHLAGDGRLLTGEILMFGRAARGERLTRGLLHDEWEIWRDGRLLWADALHLSGEVARILAEPACFDGSTACATVIYAAPDAPARIETARALAEADGVTGGVSCIGEVLVGRWLAREACHLRRAFGRFWAAFRAEVAALPKALPRIWYV